MSRSILHYCSNGNNQSTLINYLKDQGDQIHLADSRQRFQEVIERTQPALVVVDLATLGNGRPVDLESFRQTYAQFPILFTIDHDAVPDAIRFDLEESGVLIEPSTEEQVEAVLHASGVLATKSNGSALRAKRLRKILLSVQTRIAAPYVLLCLLLAMAGAFIATRTIFETSRQRFTNQLIETRKLASVWISQEEEILLEAMRLFANTQGVGAAIADGDSEGLREILFPLVLNAGTEAIEILNLEGESVLSMRHIAGGQIEDFDSTRGEDEYVGWPIVTQVLAQDSDSFGDKYASIVQASWGNYFYLAGPVFSDRGDLAGVILVGDSLPAMVQAMRVSTTGQISIYDMDGLLLSTTMMIDPDPLADEVVTSILTQQDSESFARLHLLSDITYEELLGPLELREGLDAAILGTSLPQDFLVQANTATQIQVFSLAAVGFLLIIILGVAISRTFTRPLLSLTKATSQVARGDLSVQVNIQGDDEIASLAQSFNTMIGAIKDSKVQLIEAHDHVLNAYDLTIMGWARALELRDMETEGHCRRVTYMTVKLARALGIEGEELVNIRRGALLHDIGKMGIPDTILFKPGPLTDEEWQEMHKHPTYARDMLQGIEFLRSAIDIPYAHHEKWDGSGYPRGLKGEQIPLSARIFAVVDVWDALSSDRPYRKAWPREKVIRHLQSGKGSHFDPQVLSVFLEILDNETVEKHDAQTMGVENPKAEFPSSDPCAGKLAEETELVAAMHLTLKED
ncbi:MAG: HD domain-containing phosphohydrolase [Anaerolineales bacterium]|jgi:putative nucleotidyltransferase with HDIG domain